MRIRKIGITIMFCFIFAVLLSPVVYADMGPKDRLAVYVDNPPSELYYLDLLTQNARTYNNFYDDGEREALNQEMLALLYSYESDGWKPALTEGTGVPMWGELTGRSDGSRMIHEFGYVGVPDTYRIIIVTESGKVSVSETYTRVALQSSITYDYATGTISVPPVWLAYVTQFLFTFISTLVLEGTVLILFRYRLRENWKVFILANFITQIFLTLTVGITLVKSGTISAYIIQFPIEAVILIVEAVIYRFFLVGESKGRKSAYGIIANLTSWLMGFLLLNYLFSLLTKML